MFRWFGKIIGTNVLLKVTSYNAIGIAVRMVTGLIVSKAVAFFLGSSGMALLGELRNFLSSVHSLSILGIKNGIIKYVAEHKDNRSELKNVLTTSLTLNVGAAIVVGLVIFFGAPYWNDVVFSDNQDFVFAFRLIGICLPAFMLFMYGTAVINGLGKYKTVVNIGIATNAIALIVTLLLIYFERVNGAIIALILGPVINLICILMILLYRRVNVFEWLSPKGIKNSYIKKLLSYTGMTLFSSIFTPWIYIGIRQKIIDTQSLTSAGYWDAMVRVSDYYMMFVTTLLTLYILPKLSSIDNDKDFRKEIGNFMKTVIPIFIAGGALIFLLKGVIIRTIFTAEFLAMKPIFIWQLLGDLMRVASTVLAYQFVAKNMFWHFTITNIISLAVIYFSSAFFVEQYGFTGASMGHFVSYTFYLIMMLLIFRKPLFRFKPS